MTRNWKKATRLILAWQVLVTGPAFSKHPDCLSEFAAPIGGQQTANGYFSKASGIFYFLSQEGRSQGSSSESFKYELYKMDLRLFKAEPLFAFKTQHADLFTLSFSEENDSLVGIVVLSWSDPAQVCGEGPAHYVGHPLQKETKIHPRMQGQAQIRVVQGPNTLYLYDEEHKGFIEFDFATLQSRTRPLAFKDHEVPIYLDFRKEKKYTWQFHEEGAKRGVLAYDSLKGVAGGLEVKLGDRLIQQENLFGILQTPAETANFRILKLESWSGLGKGQSYDLNLPAGFPRSEALVQVHFDQGLALVSASTTELKKKWGKIFLYDYVKGLQVATFEPPKDQYPASAGISPDGSLVLAEARYRDSDNTASFSALVVQNHNKWVPILQKKEKK